MALRLRRGTDAERLLITPVSGELIYTTDTKLLYIGDGTTAGGTLVTGGAGSGSSTLDALTDTDLTGATNNDVLKFNAGTNKWEPSIAGGSTLDALTDTDLTGAAGGEVLSFNNVTSKWESVAVPGLSALSLDDLTDVFLTSNPAEAGDILQFNGNHFVAVATVDLFNEQQNYKINIVGDDSTIMINTDNNNIVGNEITANFGFVGDLTGTVEGAVIGDLKGSVFGDDSTLIVDAINNTVTAEVVNTSVINSRSSSETIILNSQNRTPVQITTVTNGSPGGFPYTEFLSVKGTIDTPLSVAANDIIGGWKISAWDNAAGFGKATTIMASRLMSDAVITDTSPNSLTSLLVAGGGTSTSSFDFYGNGEFKAPGAITPGVYADDAARDAAIPTPTAGMMVFNTTGTKFQGYTGSAWVDLN
jgi:hypothetical protein